MMKEIRAIWELMRLEHGIMIFLGILTGSVVALNGSLPSWEKLLLTFLTGLLLEGSTFALNDYFDIDIDKKNGRTDRPLVKGDVQPNVALYLFYLLFPLGILCSYFVNTICFAIALITGLLAILYDVRLKRIKVIGNFYIAYTMAIPFIFGGAAVVDPQNIVALNPAIYIAALVAFLAGVGREMMKDVQDYEGDKTAGVNSFPSHIGIRGTCGLAAVFYLIAALLSIVPYANDAFGNYVHNGIYLGCVLVTDLFLIYMAGDLLINANKNVASYRKLTLFAIFIGLVAFLAGAFT